ncbi:hypothetical protein [Macrococcus epidermidis]|nr:hypothetical protein [Macrococcus epidermidis]
MQKVLLVMGILVFIFHFETLFALNIVSTPLKAKIVLIKKW